jgi:hypothetical protein
VVFIFLFSDRNWVDLDFLFRFGGGSVVVVVVHCALQKVLSHRLVIVYSEFRFSLYHRASTTNRPRMLVVLSFATLCQQSAKEMIDRTETHHCEGEDCAGYA